MPDDEKAQENLRRWLQEKFDLRYLQLEIFELFKKDRFGRIEIIVFSGCAVILLGVVSAFLAFALKGGS